MLRYLTGQAKQYSIAVYIIPNSAGMFNEKQTIFRNIWQKPRECEDYAGSLYIDGTWNLGYWKGNKRLKCKMQKYIEKIKMIKI